MIGHCQVSRLFKTCPSWYPCTSPKDLTPCTSAGPFCHLSFDGEANWWICFGAPDWCEVFPGVVDRLWSLYAQLTRWHGLWHHVSLLRGSELFCGDEWFRDSLGLWSSFSQRHDLEKFLCPSHGADCDHHLHRHAGEYFGGAGDTFISQQLYAWYVDDSGLLRICDALDSTGDVVSGSTLLDHRSIDPWLVDVSLPAACCGGCGPRWRTNGADLFHAIAICCVLWTFADSVLLVTWLEYFQDVSSFLLMCVEYCSSHSCEPYGLRKQHIHRFHGCSCSLQHNLYPDRKIRDRCRLWGLHFPFAGKEVTSTGVSSPPVSCGHLLSWRISCWVWWHPKSTKPPVGVTGAVLQSTWQPSWETWPWCPLGRQ